MTNVKPEPGGRQSAFEITVAVYKDIAKESTVRKEQHLLLNAMNFAESIQQN
jgi:hypothetical protein